MKLSTSFLFIVLFLVVLPDLGALGLPDTFPRAPRSYSVTLRVSDEETCKKEGGFCSLLAYSPCSAPLSSIGNCSPRRNCCRVLASWLKKQQKN